MPQDQVLQRIQPLAEVLLKTPGITNVGIVTGGKNETTPEFLDDEPIRIFVYTAYPDRARQFLSVLKQCGWDFNPGRLPALVLLEQNLDIPPIAVEFCRLTPEPEAMPLYLLVDPQDDLTNEFITHLERHYEARGQNLVTLLYNPATGDFEPAEHLPIHGAL